MGLHLEEYRVAYVKLVEKEKDIRSLLAERSQLTDAMEEHWYKMSEQEQEQARKLKYELET